MDVRHDFFLAVAPKATARTRFTCHGGFARAYTAPSYRAWLDEAVPALKAADPLIYPPELRKLPVKITTEVIVRKPKSTKRQQPAGDVDNYLKGLWDAMTTAGGWWEDDTQIVETRALKRWAADDEPEGYRVTVEFLAK